jgi:hypothetical protein
VLARIIARPIAQLDDAIRRLGRAEFERPIEVRRPARPRSASASTGCAGA